MSGIWARGTRAEMRRVVAFLAAGGALAAAACEPTVRVEPPKEPITINLNVKLDAEIRVRLEEQAKQDIATNPSIF